MFHTLTFLILVTSSSITAHALSVYNSHFIQNDKYDELLKDRPPFDRGMLRKMYYVDEWSMFPQANEKRFILIFAGPASKPIKIYDNKQLQGNPSFFLTTSGFIPNVTEEKDGPKENMTPGACLLSRTWKKKKVSKWLNCSKIPCEIIENTKRNEIEILDPYTTFWYLAENRKEKPSCPFNVPFEIYIDNPGSIYSMKQYSYLKPLEVTKNYASFEMGEKTYYLDLREVPRLGHGEALSSKANQSLYIFDFWTKPLVYTDYDMRWIIMKRGEGYNNYKDFFQKVQKCAIEKNIECLKELSYTKKEFENDDFQEVNVKNFTPIVWDEENIKEVIACTNPGTFLPKSAGLLLGINKKCTFKALGKPQLISIDLPEAFKLNSMFDEKFEVLE